MARVAEHDITPILNAAEEWKQRCLLNGGSILTDEALWSDELLEEFRRNFIENPDVGAGSFFEKFEKQMKGGSVQLPKLGAEFLWLYHLFPGNFKYATKTNQVRQVFGWSGESLNEDHEMFAPLKEGVGSAGQGFSNYRFEELSYLHGIVVAFRRETARERTRLLKKPWDFANWIDQLEQSAHRIFRHILLFLLFPDSFERVASKKHKRWISKRWPNYAANAGSEETDSDFTRLDKELLAIRKGLKNESEGAFFDFYVSPWEERWRGGEELLGGPFNQIFSSFKEADGCFELFRRGFEILGLEPIPKLN